MSEKIQFSIEIKGTKEEIQQLDKLNQEINALTESQKKLKKNGDQNSAQFQKQAIQLKETRTAYRNVQNSVERSNQTHVEERNTLRSVSSQLSILKQRLKDVEIGGEAYTKITSKIKTLEQTQRDANKTMGRGSTFVGEYSKGFISSFKQMALATVGVTVALGKIQQFVGGSIDAYEKQVISVRKVETAVKQTENAAGFTSKELQNIAADLQGITAIGDEDILGGVTAQLLTFTNISEENFKNTQKAVLDVATVLSESGVPSMTELKAISIQLGKALNDPIANLSALSRSGIQFSEQQKEQIKLLSESGRLQEAQAIILEELNRQYGGQAEAIAKTDVGKIKQEQNAIGDLQEEIGEKLIPIKAKLLQLTGALLNFFVKYGSTVARVAGVIGFFVVQKKLATLWTKKFKTELTFTGVFKKLIASIVLMGKGLGKLKISLKGARAGVSSFFGTIGKALAANPLGALVTGIMLAVEAYDYFFSSSEDAAASMSGMQKASEAAAQGIGEFKGEMQLVTNTINTAEKGTVQYNEAIDKLNGYLKEVGGTVLDYAASEEELAKAMNLVNDQMIKKIKLDVYNEQLKQTVANTEVAIQRYTKMGASQEQIAKFTADMVQEQKDLLGVINDLNGSIDVNSQKTAENSEKNEENKITQSELAEASKKRKKQLEDEEKAAKKLADTLAEIDEQNKNAIKTLNEYRDQKAEREKEIKDQDEKDFNDALDFEIEMIDKVSYAEENAFNEMVARMEQEKKLKQERIEAITEEFQRANSIMNSLGQVSERIRDQQLAKAEGDAEKQAQINERYAKRNRAIAATQIVIDGTLAVMGILAAKSLIPEPARTIFKAAQIAAIGVTTAVQLATLKSTKLASGGILQGRSHAAGGINLGGGIEAEGGESVINKRSSALFAPLLSAINSYNGFGKPLKAASGMVLPPTQPTRAASQSAVNGLFASDQLSQMANIIVQGINDKQVYVTEKSISEKQNLNNKIRTKTTF